MPIIAQAAAACWKTPSSCASPRIGYPLQGFRIRACRPYRAQTKGKVERPIHYLRHNFLYGRTFLGDADLADQCTRWLADVANVRVQATTKIAPRTRWETEERTTLLPLATRPYRSLGLLPDPPVAPRLAPFTRVTVERRRLETYADLTTGGCTEVLR